MVRTFRWKSAMRSVYACVVAGSVLSATMPAVSFAQEKAATAAKPTSQLPTAESVMDGYVTAVGGKEAMEKFKSRRSEGTFEIKQAGLTGDIELFQSAPNNFLLKIDLAGIGKIEQGTNGEVAWEVNPLTGNRMLDGAERNDLIRRGVFQQEIGWRDAYESAKVTGEEKIGDRATWVVELKPKTSDNVQTNYYDKETKLLVRTKAQVSTPMGTITVTGTVEDYQALDGIKVPMKMTQDILGNTQVIKIMKVENNAKIEPSTFEVPKDLAGKGGKSKS